MLPASGHLDLQFNPPLCRPVRCGPSGAFRGRLLERRETFRLAGIFPHESDPIFVCDAGLCVGGP